MAKSHHLQPRCHPPLLHNFKWLNTEAAKPIIQKEVDELLGKGAIKSSTDGDGFC